MAREHKRVLLTVDWKDGTRLDKCRLDYYGGRLETSNLVLVLAMLVDAGPYFTIASTFTFQLQFRDMLVC
jgi:hypothetical protein